MNRYIIILLFVSNSIFAQNPQTIEFTGQNSIHNFGLLGAEIISGTPIVTFVLFPNNEWLLFTPSGEFQGTDAALAQAKINNGKNTEPCSQKSSKYIRGLARKTIPLSAQEKFFSRITTLTNEDVAAQILSIPMVVIDPQGHFDEIMDIAATADNKMLVSVSKDKTVRLWDVETGENIRTFRGKIGQGNEGEVNRVAISPDQSTIAVGGFFDQNKSPRVGDIRFFGLATGKMTGVLSRSNNATTAIAYSKSGNLFVTGNYDKRLRIWTKDKLEAELKLKPSDTPEVLPVLQYEEGISNIAISPDEQTMVVSRFYSTNPAWFKVSEVFSGGTPQSHKYLQKHQHEIVGCTFSPNDGMLITADSKEAYSWLANGTCIDLFSKISLAVEGKIQFSPDGGKILMGNSVYGYSTKKEICYQADAGQKVGTFVGNSIAANAYENTIILWNTSTGDKIKILKPNVNEFNSAVFLNDSLKIGISLDMPLDMIGKATNYEIGKIAFTFDFRMLHLTNERNSKQVSNNLAFENSGDILHRANADNGDQNLSELKIGSSSFNEEGQLGAVKAFTYLPNGNVIVATNFYLRQYGHDGSEIKRFEGFTGSINSLALSPEGRYLLSMGSDKTIRLWDLASPGKRFKQNVIVSPLASLYISGNNEWICYTKDQFYASSRKGGQFIGFQFNNGRNHEAGFYTFEQMDLAYNRPDKVISLLGNKDSLINKAFHNAYLKRLKKYNVTESQISPSFEVPEIEILSQPTVTTISNIVLKARVKTTANPIKMIEVYINDILIKTITESSSQNEFDLSTTIELTSGKNKIHLVAIDITGQKSATETVRMFYKAAVQPKPDLYIVTFGVSDYQNKDYTLKYATKDANDIVSTFSGNKKIFNNVKTLSLNNALAVKENIDKAHQFISQSKPEDMVILFAAGHGLLNNQFDWYFAASDIDFYHPEARGISFDELEGILSKIPARKKLLLIDACHSGEADKDALTIGQSTSSGDGMVKSRGFRKIETKRSSLGLLNSFELMQQLFADLSKGTGAVVISSASGVEFAYESSIWNNGVFTFSVLEGIKSGNADLNKDGQIMTSELRDYVIKKVNRLTQGKQNPTSRKENLEFDFRVW